ncbi:MAG: glycosyltransferase [Planctomycetia bacterium]|nr:glycosyltransferase [Planctomycetia bacterium]
MRIVHITAGAGGRICGSCLHDNALVRALRGRGRDAILLPAYVPTTTDEENVAEATVVMGGVNVWLQEHVPLFRHTPAFLDRFLDSRRLLAWLSGRTGGTKAADLGGLTASSLEGEVGHQRKEVEKLARFLAAGGVHGGRPDVVHLSNVLLLGLARRIRQATGAALVCSLSGEDIFIEQIPAPHYDRIRRLLRERAADVDAFVALNGFYADFMADYLAVPRERISEVPHGVDPTGFPAAPPDLAARRAGRPGFVIGYLARACPEKGLDVLIRAVALLTATHDVRLVAAGATIDAEQPYLDRCRRLAAEVGIGDRFEWRGQVDRPGKLALLEEVDLFAMPTVHAEAKGIPVLEAFTAGLPVVAPRHGAFPEYLGTDLAAARGLLHAPGDARDLHAMLLLLADDPALAARLGAAAHAFARAHHTPAAMAAGHEALYERLR